MKKLLLFTVLLFQLTIVFGQNKTESKKGSIGIATGGYTPNRQETPPTDKGINYNNSSYQNDCYKSFAFTVKNYGYNKDGKFYSWGIKVTNNYSKAVQLKYKLIVGNDNPKYGTLTYYIKPGETYSNDFGTASAIIVNNNSDQYKIEVSEVCFEGQDCSKNGYVNCNGKQNQNNESKNVQKSNNPQNILNGINETTSSDGKMKFVNEYKDGKKVGAKYYNQGILETVFTFDSKGNDIEVTKYLPNGEVYSYKVCDKNGNCNTKFYRDGSVIQEINKKPFDWKD